MWVDEQQYIVNSYRIAYGYIVLAAIGGFNMEVYCTRVLFNVLWVLCYNIVTREH